MKGIEGLLAGHTLAGRYRIEEVIGRGGFAAVYRARDENLKRPVAVKVIMVSAPDSESRRRLRSRFHREARAAASLQHPNVVTIYDFGTDPDLGLDFLVMELLRGEDLAARQPGRGAVPVPEALRILGQAAEGVAAGHRAGLIHRDVKPGNLFLAEQEEGHGYRVKVLDFGIAQVVAAEDTITQLTHGGHALSPAYASPEQLRGERSLSPATDVYSLGVIGYEMLAGERLFGRGHEAWNRDVIPPLRQRRPEVPDPVARVIARAMEPDPTARYPDAGVLVEALEAALGDPTPEPVPERRILPRVYQARKRPRLPEEPATPVPRATRASSGRSGMLLVALVLLAAVGGLGWWALGRGAESPPVVQETTPPASAPESEGREGGQPPPPRVLEPEVAGGITGGTAESPPAPASRGAPDEATPPSWSRNAQALHREGLQLFQRRDYAGAADRFRIAVRVEPGNIAYRNDLAWALFRAGEVGEAARELEEVLRREPDRDIAHANLGEVRLAQGDTAAAIAAYRRFLELNNDPRRGRIAREKLSRLQGGGG